MEVSEPNEVKIYNLSAGRVLPEWLSDRKRRALLRKNVDLRRQIELIQDFDMPGLSTTVRVSNDGHYILATGIYKPRIKCFDVNNLSLKFERCFDSEAVTFEILSDDYSKLVFLQCDRYIEFHAAYGRYYRLRIPKYGRDMKYHYPDCDLYVVGASPEIYRLNLERGQFMTPFTSKAVEINKCVINPVHNLLICGTQEGRVEAWDPRVKDCVATLDCAFQCVTQNKELEGFPSVTALKFNGPLHMGVGTATGQVLLYDIRSDKPFIMKDHMYGFPIKDIEFHYQNDQVFSLDRSVLKIWDKNNGNLFTSIESNSEFNNLCVVPNTGLMFIANEGKKILTYYIPSLGPAPRWASFLDSLTEELEETSHENIYDDYKFVNKSELESLGLEHLIGTPLLRAYMHGYFLDIRLYKKAKSISDPFKFEDYRKKKIRETIEQERTSRVQVNKLPKVNKELAIKLMDDTRNKKKKQESNDLLQDDRFKALFENPDFEVDKNTDEFRLMNPVLSKLNKSKKSEVIKEIPEEYEPLEEKLADKDMSADEDDFRDDSSDESSSDDEHKWTKDVKKEYRLVQREHRAKERAEQMQLEQEEEEKEEHQKTKTKLYEMRQGEEYKGLQSFKKSKTNKLALGDRLETEDSSVRLLGTEVPGHLSASEVPQMILLTFEDAVNEENFDFYADLFGQNYTNPNGCPISATFFVTHQYTNYYQVQRLWNAGHEVGVHSVTHRLPEEWWSDNATVENWFDEMVGQANILHKYSNIRLSELQGLRVPFLRVGWNRQFLMMKEFGFLYDSSIVAPYSQTPLWPYTLDYKMPHRCYKQLCPTRPYQGLWEMVINQLEAGDVSCATLDSCPTDLSGQEVFEILMRNFNRHYSTNRAPFGLHLQAIWFERSEYLAAFQDFLDFALSQPNVWIVTNSQAIKWLQYPTAIKNLPSFRPWSCHKKKWQKSEIACQQPNTCQLISRALRQEVELQTCSECPKRYPWVKNEFGVD